MIKYCYYCKLELLDYKGNQSKGYDAKVEPKYTHICKKHGKLISVETLRSPNEKRKPTNNISLVD